MNNPIVDSEGQGDPMMQTGYAVHRIGYAPVYRIGYALIHRIGYAQPRPEMLLTELGGSEQKKNYIFEISEKNLINEAK